MEKRYKYCLVPGCTNTTITAPHKLFISVPKGKELRMKWCEAMGRDNRNYVKLSNNSNRFCCEDHFDVSIVISGRGVNIVTSCLKYSFNLSSLNKLIITHRR